MIVTPVNPNSVHISSIQTGCLKSEFDSTYPVHLNGIIGQDEFQQSMNNINRTISSRKSLIICSLVVLLCMVGGITLFIVGGITTISFRTHGFPLLVAVGFGVFGLGIVILFVGCCILQSRRRTRMQQAIAQESMKYSMRTPTPCSWRLNVSRVWAGGYGRRRTALIYHLVIEIGNSMASGNVNAPYQISQSASYFPQQNNMPPPSPSYYAQPDTGFCFRCGIPRQNSMAKFCPSCGQPFIN